MNWFEKLTGFPELSPAQVRENLTLAGDKLTSRVNGRTFTWGRLEIPSLGELRERVIRGQRREGRLSAREVVANVRALHADEANAGSLFQVASQFNLLEMVGPNVTPEQGIGRYENDHTQGPICAIAAGAGTIYRNYFVSVGGQTGQTATRQIDCLADLGVALGNGDQSLWEMRNGYALASADGLDEITRRLTRAGEEERDRLRQLLRIGIQWNTQVTLGSATHTVSQAYCSALPVAYTRHTAERWEAFARLVLEAAYEATICAGILNAHNRGNNPIYLTLLGEGAFGNQSDWISQSIARALERYADWNLEIAIVSYGASKAFVRQLIAPFAR